jgi:hypothetical protein
MDSRLRGNDGYVNGNEPWYYSKAAFLGTAALSWRLCVLAREKPSSLNQLPRAPLHNNVWRTSRGGLGEPLVRPSERRVSYARHSRQQLNIPIKPIMPAIVEIIGRKAPSLVLQLPVGRPDRGDVKRHMGLFGRASAFAKVAR